VEIAMILYTIIIVLIAILLINLAAGALLAVHLSSPRKRTYMDDYCFTPFETGVPFETVEFETKDKLTLRGWWLSGSRNKVIIGLSGRMGTKSDLLGVGTYLNKSGYHVLLFDYRDSGMSDPSTISMGELELEDISAAVDFASKKIPGAHVGVIGFSMGASIGICAAEKDKRISALVCDSPFSSSEDLIFQRFKKIIPLPFFLLKYSFKIWTKVIYGYDSRGLPVIDSAGRLDLVDLLVVISGRDSVIPPSQQREVYEAAAGPKQVWEFPDADHCGGYFQDRKGYVDRIISFFDKALD
jgi:pimeloyl-ACP methyl ester carboxylesterase